MVITFLLWFELTRFKIDFGSPFNGSLVWHEKNLLPSLKFLVEMYQYNNIDTNLSRFSDTIFLYGSIVQEGKSLLEYC